MVSLELNVDLGENLDPQQQANINAEVNVEIEIQGEIESKSQVYSQLQKSQVQADSTVFEQTTTFDISPKKFSTNQEDQHLSGTIVESAHVFQENFIVPEVVIESQILADQDITNGIDRQGAYEDEFIKVEIGGQTPYSVVSESTIIDSKRNKCQNCTEFTVCLIDNLGKFGGWTFAILVAFFGLCQLTYGIVTTVYIASKPSQATNDPSFAIVIPFGLVLPMFLLCVCGFLVYMLISRNPQKCCIPCYKKINKKNNTIDQDKDVLDVNTVAPLVEVEVDAEVVEKGGSAKPQKNKTCCWFLIPKKKEQKIQGDIEGNVDLEVDGKFTSGYQNTVDMNSPEMIPQVQSDVDIPNVQLTVEITRDNEVDSELESPVYDVEIKGPTLSNVIEEDEHVIDMEVEVPPVEEMYESEQDLTVSANTEFGMDVTVDTGLTLAAMGTQKPKHKVSWKGWFVQGGQKHGMELPNLSIGFDGIISGNGSDPIGDFNITGVLNFDGTFSFDKQYAEFSVIYEGNVEGLTLAGLWSLPDQPQEEFEISMESQRFVGFFEQDGNIVDMELVINNSEGGVFGCGIDEIGTFILRGHKKGPNFNFAKKYLGAHEVLYFGMYGKQDGVYVIRGRWTMQDGVDGAFELSGL